MYDDLDAVSFWTSKNGLKLNASKTQTIGIYANNLYTSTLPVVKLADTVIPFSDRVARIFCKIYLTLRKLWKFVYICCCFRIFIIASAGRDVMSRLQVIMT